MSRTLGPSLACAFVLGAAPVAAQTTTPVNARWDEIAPGGDTICARGAPFSFFRAKGGDPQRLVLDFAGGGACWNASTCAPGSIYVYDDVSRTRDQLDTATQGIYSETNPRNPVRGWSHVLIPYCTGDVHWGDAAQTYKPAGDAPFTVQHRGARNVTAVLSWVKDNMPEVKEVLVTGCSAGAYGSIYWTPAVRKMYPEATVRQFADSGAGVLTRSFMQDSFKLWNVTAHAPAWVPGLDPRAVDYSKLDITDFYSRIADYLPETTFAQFNHANDTIQTVFYVKMGGNLFAWNPTMTRYVRKIHDEAKNGNFHYFTASGTGHCASGTDEFYTARAGGTVLADWLARQMAGRPTVNKACVGEGCGNEPDVEGVRALLEE